MFQHINCISQICQIRTGNVDRNLPVNHLGNRTTLSGSDNHIAQMCDFRFQYERIEFRIRWNANLFKYILIAQ